MTIQPTQMGWNGWLKWQDGLQFAYPQWSAVSAYVKPCMRFAM